LSPLIVEALICCQNWLKNTISLVKFQEVMDEVQSIDEELKLSNLFILYLYVQNQHTKLSNLLMLYLYAVTKY
jgi:hypothetical protein